MSKKEKLEEIHLIFRDLQEKIFDVENEIEDHWFFDSIKRDLFTAIDKFWYLEHKEIYNNDKN